MERLHSTYMFWTASSLDSRAMLLSVWCGDGSSSKQCVSMRVYVTAFDARELLMCWDADLLCCCYLPPGSGVQLQRCVRRALQTQTRGQTSSTTRLDKAGFSSSLHQALAVWSVSSQQSTLTLHLPFEADTALQLLQLCCMDEALYSRMLGVSVEVY